MGSNEEIIHGARHGEVFREITPIETATGEEARPPVVRENTYYPNGIIVRSYGPLGNGVSLGVVMYDQESGNRLVGDGDEEGKYTSLWADLNRDGCNRLISAIRKHRDKRFGKDQ